MPVIEAADKVLKASKMDRIFFSNRGTDASEGAITAANKYGFTRDGHAAVSYTHLDVYKRQFYMYS